MGIQAREIVRFAKRNGMTIRRMGVATLQDGCPSAGSCALFVLASMYGGDKNNILSYLPGITMYDLNSLESGFEGWGWNTDNRYYRVGRNVAVLAGLG
jgi:hypothetical protein